jgi:molybdopterin-guanine dinucleotide biosynthesis protein
MVKVILVNGFPGVGKTTFEKECVRILRQKNKGIGMICSTVDFVKDVAKFCGWSGEKTPKNRKFLSDLKMVLTNWNDVPFHKIVEQAQLLAVEKYNYVMFVDCREPHEIQKLKDRLGAYTILIRRPKAEEQEILNSSDASVLDYDYDLTIWNEYDVEDLTHLAEYFIDKHLDKVNEYEYDY